MIDLFELGRWAAAITAVFALLFSLYKYVSKAVLVRISATEKRISTLEGWTRAQQSDINDSLEEKLILLRATRACLEALRDGKANGNVTHSIEEITGYIDTKAHRAKSKGD